MRAVVWSKKPKERDNVGDPEEEYRILKWILKKFSVRVWTGFV
jgi:hypothetical protein